MYKFTGGVNLNKFAGGGVHLRKNRFSVMTEKRNFSNVRLKSPTGLVFRVPRIFILRNFSWLYVFCAAGVPPRARPKEICPRNFSVAGDPGHNTPATLWPTRRPLAKQVRCCALIRRGGCAAPTRPVACVVCGGAAPHTARGHGAATERPACGLDRNLGPPKAIARRRAGQVGRPPQAAKRSYICTHTRERRAALLRPPHGCRASGARVPHERHTRAAR